MSSVAALAHTNKRTITSHQAEWLLVTAISAIVGLAYIRFVGNSLFGSDTWPWLQSSRVSGPADLLRLAFSPIMPGTRFAAEVANFYHPLTSLSYALDLALFGMNSVALYATNLLMHVVTVAGVYVLLRHLQTARWAATVATLAFGLHPIAVATVPSLPRRQDLLVGALLVWSMWCLSRARMLDRPNWRTLAFSLALFALALGGKEIAYAAIGVVPLVVVCTAQGFKARGVARKVVGTTGAFVAVEVLAFAVRWRVLGGLGGYYGSEHNFGRLDGVLEFFVRPYVTLTLWPLHAFLPDRLREWLIVVVVVGIVLAIAIWSISPAMRMLAVLGLGWQMSFLALYVAVHTSLSAYLLYVPSIGLALVVAANLHNANAIIENTLSRAGRAALAASVAGIAWFSAGVVLTSTLIRSYPEWQDAAFVSSSFLTEFLPCVRTAPRGARVVVDNLPHRLDYGTDESTLLDAFVFEPYSLDAAVAVLAPDAQVSVDAASVTDLRRRPDRLLVGCAPSDGGVGVSVRLGE